MINAIIKLSSLMIDAQACKIYLKSHRISLASSLIVARLCRLNVCPSMVIDVGANIGQFAVCAAVAWPHAQVISYEPVPECFKCLQKNTSMYHNISCNNIALGGRNRMNKLYITRQNQMSSLLRPDDYIRSIDINIQTLDTIFKGQRLVAPVLLKLDVQGYEIQVLRGALSILNNIQYIVAEGSFENSYENQSSFHILNLELMQYGFHLVRPLNWLLSPQGQIQEIDALFQKG